MKFEVGQKVRLVRLPDHIDGLIRTFMGREGIVTDLDDGVDDDRVWVDFGDGPRYFYASLLAPVNVTTIEGEVNVVRSQSDHAMVGDTEFVAVLDSFDGKRVKLTLEVID